MGVESAAMEAVRWVKNWPQILKLPRVGSRTTIKVLLKCIKGRFAEYVTENSMSRTFSRPQEWSQMSNPKKSLNCEGKSMIERDSANKWKMISKLSMRRLIRKKRDSRSLNQKRRKWWRLLIRSCSPWLRRSKIKTPSEISYSLISRRWRMLLYNLRME